MFFGFFIFLQSKYKSFESPEFDVIEQSSGALNKEIVGHTNQPS